MAWTVSLGKTIGHHYGLDSFFGKDHRPEVFAPSFLCVWSQRPLRSLLIIVSPRGFWYEHLKFDELSKFVMSWIDFS